MNRTLLWITSTLSLIAITLSLSLPLGAQSSATQPSDAAETPATEPTSEKAVPTQTEQAADESDQIMRQLLLKRKKPPVIEPSRRPEVDLELPETPTMPAATVNIDPSVLGIAPGEEAPPLLVDGTFIVNRRGRLIRSPEGLQIFVFESDARENPERPLILQPCKKLEGMETIVQELGDKVVFTLSGQVFLYRNNNYLLPTLFTVDYDRDNISG
ncbi:hypothetical protein [Poriferisphaera sp. WC338]|uniref:hypothetical protein n=1 Tax=Poriferisphaera sp. WC338 TaxID=3425129 RepID=UPI003D8169CA